MKGMKKKLAAAAAMLVVSAVMLSGVSYAWYTLSTNPEVKGITATATSNANLEIAYNELSTAPTSYASAADTGKYDTYGNLVVMGDSSNTASQTAWNALDPVLIPMTYASDNFQYMTYGPDGRPSALANLSVATATGANNGCGYIKLAESGKADVNYGYFVRYWMRTNYTGSSDLYLSKAATRSNDAAAVTGDGTTITLTRDTNSTVADAELAELIKHVRLGFSTGNAPVATGITVINPWTSDTDHWTLTGADGSNSRTLTMANDTDTNINLTQNADTQVFMYVYLDGTTMGNRLADAISDGTITITINTQFSNNSMTDTNGMSATGTTP